MTNERDEGSSDSDGPPYYGLPTSSPYTVDGQIEREVAMFAGARRVGGWRRWFVYGAFALAGLALLAGILGPLIAWVF